MKWGEGDLLIYLKALQVQVYEVVKGVDPITRICIFGGDDREATDGETARVVSRRVGRIRKRLLPLSDVGVRGVEFDASEEVFSCPMNPRFGDDAARSERGRFAA
jgi:hypothetical protein